MESVKQIYWQKTEELTTPAQRNQAPLTRMKRIITRKLIFNYSGRNELNLPLNLALHSF